MGKELMLVLLIVVMASFLSSFLSIYTFLKLKQAPGSRYYFVVTLLSAAFTLAYAFELTSTSIEEMLLWVKIEYLAIPFLPVFVLLMCFEYVGQKVKRWGYYALFIPPIVTIFMNFTNSAHHLYYKSIELRTDTPFPTIELEAGPFYYVHTLFLYTCMSISVTVLLIQLKHSQPRFKMQILLMVAGLLFPVVSGLFYISGLTPYGIDMGAVSLSVSSVLQGIAILSFQMFDIVPIARDTVFSSMKEGVLVLDKKGMIIDYNRSVLKIFPELRGQSIGQSISQVVRKDNQLIEILQGGQDQDCQILIEGEFRHYHIHFLSIQDKKSQLKLGHIVTFVDITERVQMQEKLKQRANIDGLTQVFNKTAFMKKTEKAFEELVAEEGSLAVVMLDVDYFKQVNDTFGHEAGDLVLTNVVNKAKEVLRPTDMMGRYGGEEFIISMPNTSLQEAYEIAGIIRTKISDNYLQNQDKEIRVTVSFGISQATIRSSDDRQTLLTLMRQADEALYTAKNKGRNQVQFYQEPVLV